jgi:hypothetical protein
MRDYYQSIIFATDLKDFHRLEKSEFDLWNKISANR